MRRMHASTASTGQMRLLAPGDRVLLLACDPSMFVQVEEAAGQEAGAAGTAAAEEGAGEGRPSKRVRPDGDGGAVSAEQADSQQQQQQQQQQPGVTAAAAGPVMLVLVGVQGSGKSTFCHSLMQRVQQGQQAQQGEGQQRGAARSWVRINQDTIAGGREVVAAAAVHGVCSSPSPLPEPHLVQTASAALERSVWTRQARPCGAATAPSLTAHTWCPTSAARSSAWLRSMACRWGAPLRLRTACSGLAWSYAWERLSHRHRHAAWPAVARRCTAWS